jgi:general secretion pathway protein G
MLPLQTRLFQTRSGFTLIEIIVALAIVGIMAVGGFTVFKYLDKAKVSKTKTELSTLRLAIEQYQTDTGAYPVTLQDLQTKPADQKMAKRWEGPYVDKEVEDGWRHPFAYELKQKGSKPPYELYSWGKDGEGSTEGHYSVWDLA